MDTFQEIETTIYHGSTNQATHMCVNHGRLNTVEIELHTEDSFIYVNLDEGEARFLVRSLQNIIDKVSEQNHSWEGHTI